MNSPGAMTANLPFSFAKRYGVVLDHSGEQPVLCYRDALRPDTLAEVSRFLQGQVPLRQLDGERFVLMEPAGPARIPLGQISDTSRQLLSEQGVDSLVWITGGPQGA